MSAPTPSDLDFSQCIQGAFNEADGSLRVDATITAPLDVNGDVLVDIRASDNDSVLVYGTQDATPSGTQQILKINSDGSINTGLTNSSVQVTQGTSPWIVSGNVNASQSGVWTTGRTWTLSSVSDSVNVGNFPATQAVTQSTSPWIISGTVTSNIGTTGGLALDSSLQTINTTLGSPFQAGGLIGNTTFASTQSGAWNITNISGTVSLPTNAAQETGGNLASINTEVTQLTNLQISSTSNVTSVPSSATSVTLLASNPSRKGAIFYNTSTQLCYVKFGVTASLTSFTIIIQPSSSLTLNNTPIYTGEIDAIWVAGDLGSMFVTELT
jgi:hypothetical protein